MFRGGVHLLRTGDSLFVDGFGRPDLTELSEDFARKLHRSLTERVLSAGDDTIVLPSHYGDDVAVRPGKAVGATIGELVEHLAPLRYDEEAFVRWASAAASDRPPNYVEILTANMGRPRVGFEELRRTAPGPQRCRVRVGES